MGMDSFIYHKQNRTENKVQIFTWLPRIITIRFIIMTRENLEGILITTIHKDSILIFYSSQEDIFLFLFTYSCSLFFSLLSFYGTNRIVILKLII